MIYWLICNDTLVCTRWRISSITGEWLWLRQQQNKFLIGRGSALRERFEWNLKCKPKQVWLSSIPARNESISTRGFAVKLCSLLRCGLTPQFGFLTAFTLLRLRISCVNSSCARQNFHVFVYACDFLSNFFYLWFDIAILVAAVVSVIGIHTVLWSSRRILNHISRPETDEIHNFAPPQLAVV